MARLSWLHGKHNLSFGGSWLYEDRTEINTYETFVSSTTQTCPTNARAVSRAAPVKATGWRPCCSTCRAR